MPTLQLHDAERRDEGVYNAFSPAPAAVLAEVAGLRASRMALAAGQQVPWHRACRSTTVFFAMRSGLAIQIQKPPFRCVLGAGEFYSVPPGVDVSAFASDGQAIEFIVFEHGDSLAHARADPPTLAHVGERSPKLAVPLPDPCETPHTAEHSARLVPGLSRMDVVASPPELRLIVQGHRENECVPMHSHDAISDTFFCVSGRARIETREPDQVHFLVPGEMVCVPPGVPHQVSGHAGQPCEVLILQGVGRYNYVPR